MADPVATFVPSVFGPAKKVIAFGERFVAQGGNIQPEGADDLQLFIDEPVRMQRLVHYIKAGAPTLRPVVEVLPPFVEPESHRKAQEILGPENFHGIMAAQMHFGVYSEEELAARLEIPFSEETLRECAKDFFLCATHPLDLPGIHAAHPARFTADPDDPWFGAPNQRKKWSSRQIAVPWLLMRKGPVPDSGNKRIAAQEENMKRFPRERLVLPCEFNYGVLLRFLETGQKLCEGLVVRFAVQTAEGGWVGAGWYGDRLHVNDGRGRAGDGVVSSSARTS